MSEDDPVESGPTRAGIGRQMKVLSDLCRNLVTASWRYSDAMGLRSHTHRTHLSAVALLMQASEDRVEVSPGMLGRELSLSSPATTALLDRLEAIGHARRERSVADRRRVIVSITDEALRFGGEMYGPLWTRFSDAMARFSTTELDAAARVMTAMVAATRDAASAHSAAD